VGFWIPLIPLLFSIYGVLYVFVYEAVVGESVEEVGDGVWLKWIKRVKEGWW